MPASDHGSPPTENDRRLYRRLIRPNGLEVFSVKIDQTDLLVAARTERPAELAVRTRNAVLAARSRLENRIARQPSFLHSLEPLPLDELAPPIVRTMLRAGSIAGVGPMAAVAGAVAEEVGRDLLQACPEVLIENGGDLFIAAQREITLGLHLGDSPLNGRLGLIIPAKDQPLGAATSTGKFGHSLSLGAADAATVLARSAALADAAATALGNRISRAEDLESALNWAAGLDGVEGALAVLGDRLAAWGRIELTEL